MEISEVIRRWQTGESRRHIASGTGLSKDTVGRYISAAEALGIARDGPGPDEEQVSSLAAIGRSGPRQREAPTAEKLAPWADQIYQWITVDRLQLTRIQELLAERDCRVPYTSLHRFVDRRQWRRRRANTVRMGGERPWGSSGAGLRTAGLHPGPGDRPPAGGMGAAGGADLLPALLRVARLRPEAGGGHRRPGGGLEVLRRHSQIPGHRQLPRRSGRR